MLCGFRNEVKEMDKLEPLKRWAWKGTLPTIDDAEAEI